MGSKSIRNLIIALIILAIGVKAVMIIFNNYLSKLQMPGNLPELVGSVEGMGTLLIYGIIVIIIISIPFYLSARSKEKEIQKGTKTEKTVV